MTDTSDPTAEQDTETALAAVEEYFADNKAVGWEAVLQDPAEDTAQHRQWAAECREQLAHVRAVAGS